MDKRSRSQRESDRATAKRIPYKTKAALEDLTAELYGFNRDCDALLDRARATHDPRLLALVARLAVRVPRMLRIATHARQGRYEEGYTDE